MKQVERYTQGDYTMSKLSKMTAEELCKTIVDNLYEYIHTPDGDMFILELQKRWKFMDETERKAFRIYSEDLRTEKLLQLTDEEREAIRWLKW